MSTCDCAFVASKQMSMHVKLSPCRQSITRAIDERGSLNDCNLSFRLKSSASENYVSNRLKVVDQRLSIKRCDTTGGTYDMMCSDVYFIYYFYHFYIIFHK